MLPRSVRLPEDPLLPDDPLPDDPLPDDPLIPPCEPWSLSRSAMVCILHAA